MKEEFTPKQLLTMFVITYPVGLTLALTDSSPPGSIMAIMSKIMIWLPVYAIATLLGILATVFIAMKIFGIKPIEHEEEKVEQDRQGFEEMFDEYKTSERRKAYVMFQRSGVTIYDQLETQAKTEKDLFKTTEKHDKHLHL